MKCSSKNVRESKINVKCLLLEHLMYKIYVDSRHYRNEKAEIAILRVEENDRLREKYFQEAYYDG